MGEVELAGSLAVGTENAPEPGHRDSA
jgi:hypothetical protein